ncbi:hypothetical protein PGTUg99_026977 [Puccinia graminis f. sp. tritici]|uniref:CobW/HypB/UreG nucleotide-binding domain-containing protein n=1 Tax=Puccinia graminis f. sp. tritici TaxID=56615 RepID=A0A5B0Q9C9_PUCGR|nr:hypothetical protein PGTUg99_026977 [Puccinia graminis f. sp. tritici]
MADLQKVPVTILSGQLGSGKSTLLRRLLTNQNQLKIAIVMNEFAQTASIEGLLQHLSSLVIILDDERTKSFSLLEAREIDSVDRG